jgi:hypothetical protein
MTVLCPVPILKMVNLQKLIVWVSQISNFLHGDSTAETLAQHGLDGCGHPVLPPPPPPLRPPPSLVPGPVFRCSEPRRRGQGVRRPQPPASVPQRLSPPFFSSSLPRCNTNLTAHPSLYAEGPSHAHTAAREPAQLILLGKALLIPHPFFSRLPSEHRHSYFSANLCCVLRCVGAHGAARVEGGVRRPPASPHGRHRLRCASATLI